MGVLNGSTESHLKRGRSKRGGGGPVGHPLTPHCGPIQ